MFDLEQSITDWRQQMLAAGIKTPTPLDELEIHLREEIELQMKSRLSGSKVFEIAAQKIGRPLALKNEFKKSEKIGMKVGMGLFGVIIGTALMVPGSLQLQDELVVADGRLALWLLGMILLMWSFDLFRKIVRAESSDGESGKVKISLMTQIFKISAGVIVLLTGLAFLMPVITQAGCDGRVKFDGVCYLMFGVALLITGALVTFCPYQQRKT
jgi:hypothetical protein